jgi:putative transposase
MEQVEFETLKWVDWHGNLRLVEPIGDIPPSEFEALHYEAPVLTAGLT